MIRFIQDKSRKEVVKEYPDHVKIVKVIGGYAVFETWTAGRFCHRMKPAAGTKSRSRRGRTCNYRKVEVKKVPKSLVTLRRTTPTRYLERYPESKYKRSVRAYTHAKTT